MSDGEIQKTKITTPLGTFEFEGSKAFVEKQIGIILKKVGSIPIVSMPDKELTESSVSDSPTPKRVAVRKVLVEQPQMIPNLISDADQIEGLRSFYSTKKPSSHMETFAVLTLWLKNNCNLQDVSINEMWTLYKILNIKSPKALVQVFRDGKSKRAYFEAATAVGRYFLTPFGETFVDHDLPRKIS